MTLSKPIFWDWIDKNASGGSPLKLLPNAPENMKKSFREWQKIEADYEKQWKDAEKERTNKPNKKALQYLNELINVENDPMELREI